MFELEYSNQSKKFLKKADKTLKTRLILFDKNFKKYFNVDNLFKIRFFYLWGF